MWHPTAYTYVGYFYPENDSTIIEIFNKAYDLLPKANGQLRLWNMILCSSLQVCFHAPVICQSPPHSVPTMHQCHDCHDIE